MKKLHRVIKVGSRSSKLAIIQAKEVINNFSKIFPWFDFKLVRMSSPGDRDLSVDLRQAPDNFFTADLDKAVLDGVIDMAVHSAKDLPQKFHSGLDWVWLPWKEDPRDAIVIRKGEKIEALRNPVCGVSSVRRENYCLRRFKSCVIKPLRGSIELRLQQLDNGKFDVIIIALAAMKRLGLEERVTEVIPLSALNVPEGQGVLAITFRRNNKQFVNIRNLFIKPIVFVGAGPGNSELCTVAGINWLSKADVCLYDALINEEIFKYLPFHALKINIGHRAGMDNFKQFSTCSLMEEYAKKGLQVVRLKGGDAGIYSRLAEEIQFLNGRHIPYKVIPGISSIVTASTGTGMLLTRNKLSHGFCVLTPQRKFVHKLGKLIPPIDNYVILMGKNLLKNIIQDLIKNKLASTDTNVAVIFNSTLDNEIIINSKLKNIYDKVNNTIKNVPFLLDSPAIILVGNIAKKRFLYRNWGPLHGRRLLLTCSDSLLPRAIEATLRYGGIPISKPMIKLAINLSHEALSQEMAEHKWVILSSPSVVNFTMKTLIENGFDMRLMPKVVVSGPKTAEELKRYGIIADLIPSSNFGERGIVNVIKKAIPPNTRILRLRSDKADFSLTNKLIKEGFKVVDKVLYRNEPIVYNNLPVFDAVVFASSSAVESFLNSFSTSLLTDKQVAVIGDDTCKCADKYGIQVNVKCDNSTIDNLISQLACYYIGEKFNITKNK